MKNLLHKILLGLIVVSSNSLWSQCIVPTCAPDTTVMTDSVSCTAIVSYAAPTGVDTCNSANIVYNYSGAIENWVVPTGVTSIHIEAKGAQGSYNTSSSVQPGMGATMSGDFTVTPGQTIKILVGQQYSANGGNGGGGGTFVTDVSNTPLIIAGGGGGSGNGGDNAAKHGQTGTTGGTGSSGGGTGGTNGSGGNAGATFASGAGGGLLTDGADGWTANSGGDAFVNGGAGANVGFGIGGFGGGGNGSGYVVGGGGGGYSGGGSASNSQNGGGVGGGGASYNAGTNQVNTGGNNTGHGSVTITYASTTVTSSLISGIGSGNTYPVGTTTDTYMLTNGVGDTSYCSVNITVADQITPTVVSPADVASCDPVVIGLTPTTSDNCSVDTVTYTMTGATTGSGSTDASGTTFNVGVTTVWYIATDPSGNSDSSSFTVTIYPLPNVSIAAFANDTICANHDPVALPAGTPASGTYTGTGVSGSNFDPSLTGNGVQWVYYSYTDSLGCTNTDSTMIIVDGCASIIELKEFSSSHIYPNPGNGLYTLTYSEELEGELEISIFDVNGKTIYKDLVLSENATEVLIDISNAENGVYSLVIKSSEGLSFNRIVKQ